MTAVVDAAKKWPSLMCFARDVEVPLRAVVADPGASGASTAVPSSAE